MATKVMRCIINLTWHTASLQTICMAMMVSVVYFKHFNLLPWALVLSRSTQVLVEDVGVCSENNNMFQNDDIAIGINVRNVHHYKLIILIRWSSCK